MKVNVSKYKVKGRSFHFLQSTRPQPKDATGKCDSVAKLTTPQARDTKRGSSYAAHLLVNLTAKLSDYGQVFFNFNLFKILYFFSTPCGQ